MTRTVGACNWMEWNCDDAQQVVYNDNNCQGTSLHLAGGWVGGEQIEINGELKNCSGTRVNVQ